MSSRNRIVRWTFTRFRNWSAGVRDARDLARRYQELAHRTTGDRVRRRVRRSDIRAAALANAF